jgi:molybdate transport system regulatory protein
VNAEVLLDIDAGGTITAVLTNQSAQSLELAVGKPAIAIFKPSSVIARTLA